MVQLKRTTFNGMKKAFPQLESARTILRFAEPEDVTVVIIYYTANRIHLAPFKPIRAEDFYIAC